MTQLSAPDKVVEDGSIHWRWAWAALVVISVAKVAAIRYLAFMTVPLFADAEADLPQFIVALCADHGAWLCGPAERQAEQFAAADFARGFHH